MSRYITREYKITFITPAFLGGADQSAHWRTPPFKALLRQWWRVAYAAEHKFEVDTEKMREVEGKLFGNAWLEKEFSKSKVRMRLSSWEEGKLTHWEGDSQIDHPEVDKPVGANLYLGYGPLTFNGNTALKARAAIQSDESATLSIAYPEEEERLILHAMFLINQYGGSIGGRSRNGWGSFTALPVDNVTNPQFPQIVIPLPRTLEKDWPHAIGLAKHSTTEKFRPLVWDGTQTHNSWKAAMISLARIKIDMRTMFKFPSEATPHQNIQDRHWLSYPITKHGTKKWGNNARLPNSLRMRVIGANKKFQIQIYHMPVLPPKEFTPDINAITRVWTKVYDYLDKHSELKRV